MKRIKELREIKKLTLDELSNLTHIHKSTLSRIENDIQEAKQSHIEILSDFFNVSSDYLLEKTNIKSKLSFSIGIEDGFTENEEQQLIQFAKFLKFQRENDN